MTFTFNIAIAAAFFTALLGVFAGLLINRGQLLRALRERKRAEAELRELNATLEQRVKDETRKGLEQERLLIQQSKLAAMGEMIGAIAHQWRQPLNSVGLSVQLLEDAFEYGEIDKAYIEKTITETMAQVSFMSRTIDDFRNFFKPSRGEEPFDVASAVRETLSLVAAQLTANFIDVDVVMPRLSATVIGYPNEFKQVILNLITNAKDAITSEKKKGVLREGKIYVAVRAGEGKTIIEISDNAGGIPEAVMDRIFEPYFTTREEGTGIGLYMSKTIVEKNMGGRLGFVNGAEGAVFTIELDTEPQQ